MTRRLFLYALLSVAAVAPALGDAIPVNARQILRDDPRMKTEVTVTHRRVVIGELLEEITAKTGINVSCKGNDYLNSVPISAFCDQTPLAELLEYICKGRPTSFFVSHQIKLSGD